VVGIASCGTLHPHGFRRGKRARRTYIAGYKAFILPSSLPLRRSGGQTGRYVERGGNLISEAGQDASTSTPTASEASFLPPRRSFSVYARSLTRWCVSRTMRYAGPTGTHLGEFLEATMLTVRSSRGQVLRPTFTLRRSSARGASRSCLCDAIAAQCARLGGASLAPGHLCRTQRHRIARPRRRLCAGAPAACGVEPIAQGRLLLRKRVTPQGGLAVHQSYGSEVTEPVTCRVGRRWRIARRAACA